MSLVENIQSLCKANKTSIPKLEKEFDWGHGAIYRWNDNSPSIEKLQKIAEYFNVTTDYLLGNEILQIEQKYIEVPLDPETLKIMCRIPLLSKNNKSIIADMIESMIKNQ